MGVLYAFSVDILSSCNSNIYCLLCCNFQSSASLRHMEAEFSFVSKCNIYDVLPAYVRTKIVPENLRLVNDFSYRN